MSHGSTNVMANNRTILNHLFATGQIDLRQCSRFETPPPPMPTTLNPDNIAGMLLGLAIGDALGNTSESLSPSQRHARYGEIRDYIEYQPDGRTPIGYPSDDTQLAFWTIEQLLMDGRLIPDRLAEHFCNHPIYGIGQTVEKFLQNYQIQDLPWYQSGPQSAGNGALMRIAPVLLPHLTTVSADLWVDTALAAMLTHNDAASTSACIAFVSLCWSLLPMSAPPSPSWWIDHYVSVAQELEGMTHYHTRRKTSFNYRGSLWRLVDEHVRAAYRQDLSVREACGLWYSGAFLLETVPSVLYILMRHADDPEEAIIRAVNDTHDNDTIAAIVGAAVGALHGQRQLPQRWQEGLSGRTRQWDDGRVQTLIEHAVARWWTEARQQTPPTTRPIDGCYWVVPGRVLAGEYPYSLNEDETIARLERFLDAGVTVFLDLTEEDENVPYHPLLERMAHERDLLIVYQRLPICDFGVACEEEMRTILDTIDAAVDAGHTVYVHCWFGVGRTGTVVGCYLVRHGLDGEEALERIAELLRDTSKSHAISPVTEEQRRMVQMWQENIL